jgi:hypothetical protein
MWGMKKIILLFIIFLSLVACLLSLSSAQAAGLVPCGGEGQNPCTWCHLMQLIKNVINFLMYIVFPLAAIMIVVGGIMIMTAGGSTERVAKGKEIVTAAVVGLLIALLSWLIIDTIIGIIAVGWDSLKIGPWNKLKC